ncbi:MAG: BatB protein, partial [Gammaproteobacteria bacterium]
VERLLQEAQIGLAGKETAIGDAIGLAVKRLADEPPGQKVLILLTDGANTAGNIDPLKAAQLANKTGLKIYTIGVGSVRRRQSAFGFNSPGTDLDEPTLRKIAEITGGRYFRARNTRELQEIYQELDKLEAVGKDSKSLRPMKSLYTWPLSLSLLLAMLIAILRRR